MLPAHKDSLVEFGHKSLPSVPPWTKMIGPGLVWMALAQGSGELIWWPYMIAKYGLAFLFLLIPACLIQYPLTFEVGRYTLLTGEGLFRGFFRLNKVFGILLWILFTLSFLWFGAFATAGATAIAELTQFPIDWTQKARTLFWAQCTIIIFTLAILYAKRVYQLIEWVMKIVAILSLVGMFFACCHPKVFACLGEFIKGLFVPDIAAMKTFDAKADSASLLTAITFAGLGGFWSMFYSYWIKEKGAGMAGHMSQLTGFRSGVTAIRSGEAALPLEEDGTAARLKQWYRYLSLETFIGIVGNILTTLMTCLLAFALLHPEGKIPEGFEIAVVQSEFFAVTWGDLGKVMFLFIAGAFLADTWLATVDCVSRIHLDALGSIWPKLATKDIRPWYFALVIILAIATSITMFFDQPGNLLKLSALIGFVGMIILSTALIYLNHFYLRRKLASSLRSGPLSKWLFIFTTLCNYVLAGLFIYYRFCYH